MKLSDYLKFILLMTFLFAITTYSDQDSLKIKKTETELSIKEANSTNKSVTLKNPYFYASFFSFLLMAGWLTAVFLYLRWAIDRYGRNYGLTDEEWKIINPEAYANDCEIKDYIKKRSQIIERAKNEHDLLNPGKPFDGHMPGLTEPLRNPYFNDSFGLPPGTIRGILALTAMVAFVLIELANLFSPVNLEKDFSELMTVFEMVIAFYFGARAVEIFKKKQVDKTAADEELQPSKIKEKTTVGIEEKNKVESSATVNETQAMELPAEIPVMPVEKVNVRLQNTSPVIVKPELITKIQKKSIESLEKRILGLTASFETGIGFPECFGAVSGNFDGQGLSFGALQWCIGQGSLQELFNTVRREYLNVLTDVFTKDQLSQFENMLDATLTDQIKWAKSIQITERRPNNSFRWIIIPEWKKSLQNLGLTEEMIGIQVAAASVRFAKAKNNCTVYDLHSERGLALMFDINVQNGHVDVKGAGSKIMSDYQGLTNLTGSELEVERMRIIAHRRSEVSKPQWVQDVLSRKMTIAEGVGIVHGKKYSLESEFSITLNHWESKEDVNLQKTTNLLTVI